MGSTFWESRRQEHTIQSTSLLSQRLVVLTICRITQSQIKKFSKICYFEVYLYQTLFWKDFSQKFSFTGKETPANNYKQLGYPTGLGEMFKGG